MDILKELINGIYTISLIGRLDTTTVPLLEAEADLIFKEEFKELIFDFEKLDYVSSAGLRMMLMYQKKINELQRKMKLINVNENVMEVFEMTGFDDILHIEL